MIKTVLHTLLSVAVVVATALTGSTPVSLVGVLIAYLYFRLTVVEKIWPLPPAVKA